VSRLHHCCAVLSVVAGLTACGGQAPAPPPDLGADSGHAGQLHAGSGHAGHGPVNDPSTPVVLFAVQSAPLGVVATDGGGRLLYRSDTDRTDPPTSNCAGPCTSTWAPLVVNDGQEVELDGVAQDRVGRLRRADGTTQLTLAGWPLYVRSDDDGQLATTGANGAEGNWWAVRPTGDKAAGS
jgi:predicted lipoprotein with Yx(FWY)xxD motif